MNQPSVDLTRRSFLRAGTLGGAAVLGAGGLASLLAACGGSDSPGAAPTGALTAADISAATGTIDVMTFAIFQAPELSAGSVTSSFTTIESTADILAKLRSQDFKPGIVDTGQNTMPELYALDRLVPIRTDLLPTFGDLDQDLVSNPAFAKGGDVYAIPFSVAACMTAWDSKKVPEPTTAEQLLSADYRNGIALANSSDTLLFVHHALGGDLSAFTQADLDDVLAYLDKLRPNVKTFNAWQDVELLGRGEVTVLFLGATGLLEPTRAANPAVKANFLGAMTYADCWAISDTADPARAHAWLDNALGAEAQRAVMKTSGGFPSLNSAANAKLFPQELRDLTVSQVIEKAPLVPGVVVEKDGDLVTRTELEDAWTTYQGSF